MTDSQIAKIKEIYNNWQSADTAQYQDVPELCKAVMIEEIVLRQHRINAKNRIIQWVPNKNCE